MSSSETPNLTAFTAGDLVISVVGDGDGSGDYTDNQASPITLEELTPDGTASAAVVGQLVLPQTTVTNDGTTEYAISGEYGSSSEGALELSGDGQSLVIGGYGVNAATYNTGGAAVYGDAALAQSTSLTDTSFTPVARVIADIGYDGSVNTTTALYNIDNGNNIRSVATENGTTFYVSGQGQSGDTTQGVFVAQDGADSATAIDTSTDTRTAEIVDGVLYVSRDSKQGGGGTSNISSYGSTLPTSATAPTALSGIDGTVTLGAGQGNGIADVGTTVNLSPENFFFANVDTLYVADGGNPKEGGLGDGGLQKWTFNGTSWQLDYTLSDGLNLVDDTATSGTTGLIGLTGTVDGGVVELYATNSTIGDLDPTYLFGITDTLSATTLPTDEIFTTLVTAAPDTNIRGIAFAPSAADDTPTSTTVSAGAPSTDLQVTSGGSVTVLAGGALISATILSGGTAFVSSGGTDTDTTIGSGGTETLEGSATGDLIDGTQLVSGSGTASAVVSNETVFNGGTVDLALKGIAATDITLTNGGVLLINGNIAATDTVISSGGLVDLQSAKATLGGSLTFIGSGTLEIDAVATSGYGVTGIISGFGKGDTIDVAALGTGGTLTTSVVSGNTVATVTNGGTSETFTFAGSSIGSSLSLVGTDIAFNAPVISVTSTTVSTGSNLVVSGATELIVASGGTVVDTTILNGGTLLVSGAETGSVISSGGNETVVGSAILDQVFGSASVVTGGAIVSATILSGGSLMVAGSDTDSVISAGGNETVLGTATGDQIYGTQLVSAATAVVNGETVFAGGVVDMFLKGVSAHGLIVSGGTININGNATAYDTVLTDGGVLDMQSPKGVLANTLTFSGAGTLEETSLISAGYGAFAVISGFGAGDVIDTTWIGTGATLTSAVVGANTVETITSGSSTQSFTFAGTYDSGYFELTPDSVGGVQITAAEAPCYCPGTLIETDRGEVAVEALRVGDLVRSAFGGHVPVIWTGHRRVDCRKHPRPHDILPVRIAAGAFGENMPRRDLLVSPDHALYVDEVLIPARYLINGTTIRQEKLDHLTYWHVELPAHDVMLAEGLPAESYLDTGNRHAFAEAPGPKMLHPDFALRVWESAGCASLVTEGAKLAEVKTRLIARATALGFATTLDAAPCLIVGNAVIAPRREGQFCHFDLPAGASRAWLNSRRFRPAQLVPESTDHRDLGVAVASLTLDDTAIDLAALSDGWLAPEPGLRWTNGMAELPLAGQRRLTVELVEIGLYWVEAPAEALRAAS